MESYIHETTVVVCCKYSPIMLPQFVYHITIIGVIKSRVISIKLLSPLPYIRPTGPRQDDIDMSVCPSRLIELRNIFLSHSHVPNFLQFLKALVLIAVAFVAGKLTFSYFLIHKRF